MKKGSSGTESPAAGTSLVVITPDAALPEGVLCEVTVVATEVTDLYGTPDNMVADFQFSFTTEVTAAGQSTVAVSSPTIVADGNAQVTVTVTVRDALGNPIPNQPVVLAVSGTGNTITQPSTNTSGAGVVQGSFKTTVAEVKTVSATVVPTIVPAVPITQTQNVTANPPPP